jgi:hypothetical protein
VGAFEDLGVVAAAQLLADRSAQLFGLGEDVLKALGGDDLDVGGLMDLGTEKRQSSQPVAQCLVLRHVWSLSTPAGETQRVS